MQTPGSLAPAAEAALFQNTLSCQLHLPARFDAGADAGTPQTAEALLRSLGQIEDLHNDEAAEDRSDLPPLVQRMDAKLDLMLALVGRLVRQGEQGPAMGQVHWSVRGICLCGDAPAGTTGCVRLQAAEWLPEQLRLPAQVLANAADRQTQWLWLRFAPLGAGLQNALERHLFRLHRRQVAQTRRHR